MQYPIIDNLIYAYLRNGWTGLNVTEGKNLFDYQTMIDETNYGWLRDDGRIVTNEPWRLTNYIPIYNNTLTLSPTMGNLPSIVLYDENKNYITGKAYLTAPIITIESDVPVSFCRFSINPETMPIDEIQLEYGSEATPYEPYAPPTTDIKDRLKLPMIHYFPHPVIDALISAADGQHTEEEKEILRHYLTPLGIGGI